MVSESAPVDGRDEACACFFAGFVSGLTVTSTWTSPPALIVPSFAVPIDLALTPGLPTDCSVPAHLPTSEARSCGETATAPGFGVRATGFWMPGMTGEAPPGSLDGACLDGACLDGAVGSSRCLGDVGLVEVEGLDGFGSPEPLADGEGEGFGVVEGSSETSACFPWAVPPALPDVEEVVPDGEGLVDASADCFEELGAEGFGVPVSSAAARANAAFTCVSRFIFTPLFSKSFV